jgi:hypothetical protein
MGNMIILPYWAYYTTCLFFSSQNTFVPSPPIAYLSALKDLNPLKPKK